MRAHLVGVCDNEGALVGEVVVEIGDDLDSDVRLATSWGPDHLYTPNTTVLGHRLQRSTM